MPHQPQLISEPKTPYEAAREAEREAYLEKLRQHLQDPEFRAIEGFPIGEDKDILALSDPPYYTACPNPFLTEIIEQWQLERTLTREELGLPDDNYDGDNGNASNYHREPFAADVREGKNDPIYNAHSYHTKVPHRAIMRYILHYTDPGDIIYDGFCGSGMAGVAAQLCANRRAIESLGYHVTDRGQVHDGDNQVSQLGERRAVMIDLSPAASFLAYNHTASVDAREFRRAVTRILARVDDECEWMYKTLHSDGVTKCDINYTVWSDVFMCPECGAEIVFWDTAIDHETGKVRESFPCPQCNATQTKRSLSRAQEVIIDHASGEPTRRAKQVPSLIHYGVDRISTTKSADRCDIELVSHIAETGIPYWFPSDRIDRDIDLWYERDYRSLGLYSVDGFYTHRNLYALAATWRAICDEADSVRKQLMFVFTGTIQIASRMSSFRYDSRNPNRTAGGILKGALYIPSLSKEGRVTDLLGRRANFIARMYRARGAVQPGSVAVSTSASSSTQIPSNSIDYVFTDPPFGSNIIYSDLSLLWETWLGVSTNTDEEAVIHRRKKKGAHTLDTYREKMITCFQEYYRIIKPGRWLTVEFHNTQNAVWNVIQQAISRSGFVVADIRTLDKGSGSFKQITAAGAVRQDLIISAYKPLAAFEKRFLRHSGDEMGVWDFIRQHLTQLPVVVKQDEALEIVAEREAYLLFDRMVAFHIQRGFTVPMGAAEFYAGLRRRLPERDGMYFLPEQAAEYDKHRLQARKVEQLALFVTDEKSALQWLRRELDPETGTGPQTYQDLQPKFLRELHQARHEDLPELSEMLAQSFLQDDADRWYLPDPARQEDLEQLRERALLREFAEYAKGKGRLKTFRTEAVRAGFKHAWSERAYRTIVDVAERLPTDVLQEDPALLMYYDNALLRVDEEPEQGALW